MSGAYSEICVCFEPPAADPLPHVLILSFMAPGAEAAVEQRWGSQVVSGRQIVQDVRTDARAAYVQVIARLGATPSAGGRTLRQLLQGPDGYSRWWFLGITDKDCVWDADAIYTTALRLAAVREAQTRYDVRSLSFHGAPREFAAALGAAPGTANAWWVTAGVVARAVAVGILGRLSLTAEYLGLWWALRRLPAPAAVRRDVLLQGYWDWSVRQDGAGALRDRYFTDLPAQLARRGLSVGWLASCETGLEPWQRGRRRRDVLAAAGAHPGLTLLERYVAPADIARIAWNLRSPLRVTRFALSRQFLAACRVGTLDLAPVVRPLLLNVSWGSTACRCELVATATARACRQLRPAIVLTFMELFTRARALYAGVRASGSRALVWAAQHAGYSSDKTLGVFDPALEVRGEPDDCPIPAPDGLFVMGDLSRRIWERNELGRGRIVPTGGLRYHAVHIETRIEPRMAAPPAAPAAEGVSILLVGGMNAGAEVDLCDAAVAAVKGLESVHLSWRDHPNYRFSQRAVFDRFRKVITVTSGSLDEDLRTTALVLFTHAGVAEEAVLQGIPTWQWLWPGFNTSPFLDVPVIPAFTSVAALRRELETFLEAPEAYRPTADVQARVLHECFGPDPAGASVRIADAVQQMISTSAVAHA